MDDVLIQILKQAKKDLDFMRDFLPYKMDAQSLFYFLHSKVSYRDDPPNTELIQSPKSLFFKNYYDTPGMGDCDCFSCLTICALVASGYDLNLIDIKLTGKTKNKPTHIFILINNIPFDLTNSFFGQERNYNFGQVLNIKQAWQRIP